MNKHLSIFFDVTVLHSASGFNFGDDRARGEATKAGRFVVSRPRVKVDILRSRVGSHAFS